MSVDRLKSLNGSATGSPVRFVSFTGPDGRVAVNAVFILRIAELSQDSQEKKFGFSGEVFLANGDKLLFKDNPSTVFDALVRDGMLDAGKR